METPDQPAPYPLNLDALHACNPDDQPLRNLILNALKRDPRLLEELANGEPIDYEGNHATLYHLASTKSWPAQDHGWVGEACSLIRYEWWDDQPSPPKKRTRAKTDNKSDRFTLSRLAACTLLGDIVRHAPFEAASVEDEPTAYTCLTLADTAAALGPPWTAAATQWLASYALWIHESDTWLRSAPDVLATLALLNALRNDIEHTDLPVDALLTTAHALEGRPTPPTTTNPRHAAWLAAALDTAEDWPPLAVADHLIDRALRSLASTDRRAAEQTLHKLQANPPRPDPIKAKHPAPLRHTICNLDPDRTIERLDPTLTAIDRAATRARSQAKPKKAQKR